jgi:hypothetical protein
MAKMGRSFFMESNLMIRYALVKSISLNYIESEGLCLMPDALFLVGQKNLNLSTHHTQ